MSKIASQDIGKKFEERYRKDYQRCFPGTLIHRLPDQQSGFAGGGGSNPCDFFCYPGDCVLMAECKAHAGASIPFSAIRQYEKMKDYRGLKNTHVGVIVWFYEKDTIIWVSIDEMVKMREVYGEKSIGLRMLKLKENYPTKYRIINVPASKLRTFMEADLKYLVEVLNGERSE